MKALIALNEPREAGYRVAQVEADSNIFPVASELVWVDCPDDLVADAKWFDPIDASFKEFPPRPAAPNQPLSEGAQTL